MTDAYRAATPDRLTNDLAAIYIAKANIAEETHLAIASIGTDASRRAS